MNGYSPCRRSGGYHRPDGALRPGGQRVNQQCHPLQCMRCKGSSGMPVDRERFGCLVDGPNTSWFGECVQLDHASNHLQRPTALTLTKGGAGAL